MATKPNPIVQGDQPQTEESGANKIGIYNALCHLMTAVANGSPEASCVATIPGQGQFKISVSRPLAIESEPAGEA